MWYFVASVLISMLIYKYFEKFYPIISKNIPEDYKDVIETDNTSILVACMTVGLAWPLVILYILADDGDNACHP